MGFPASPQCLKEKKIIKNKKKKRVLESNFGDTASQAGVLKSIPPRREARGSLISRPSGKSRYYENQDKRKKKDLGKRSRFRSVEVT